MGQRFALSLADPANDSFMLVQSWIHELMSGDPGLSSVAAKFKDEVRVGGWVVVGLWVGCGCVLVQYIGWVVGVHVCLSNTLDTHTHTNT